MKITQKNYFEQVRKTGFENLPEPLKKSHLVIMTRTDQGKDWGLYKRDKEFQKMVDLAFEKLGDFVRLNKGLSGTAEEMIDNVLQGKPVEALSGVPEKKQVEGEAELMFISRFLRLTGKRLTKAELKKFIDALQDAILKKKIRKTSQYAWEIMYIQKALLDIYNGMKRREVMIQLKKSTSKRLKTIVTKAKNKKKKQTAAEKLVTLQGMPSVQEETAPPAPQNTVMSSVDFAEMQFETLGFSKKWRDLMGDPSPGFSAMVFGKPKTGKSYLSVDFAGYLARHHGDTLYVAKEEKLDATLHKKLSDKDVAHPGLFVSDYLPDDLSKYNFIVIDSVNKLGLTPKDLDKLRADNPGKSFIFIFQTTKQGQFRGRNEFQHDVDVVIEIPERGKAVQFGRFNQGGEMQIFEEEEAEIAEKNY